jgi:hypothetical protein
MTRRKTPYNSTYKKLAVQCSADTFVVNQSLVLRIYICGKNRQLLVAANRYAQGVANARKAHLFFANALSQQLKKQKSLLPHLTETNSQQN